MEQIITNTNLKYSYLSSGKRLVLDFFFSHISKVKVKLATVVECDQKAPFSIATTLRCRGGLHSFPRLLHFTLDTYLILLSVSKEVSSTILKNLWYDATWDWTQVSRTTGEHSTH